jgi:hypothetical protein
VLVIALIVALLATGLTQMFAYRQRQVLVKAAGGQAQSSIAGMDSFALALLLGGLRGPLVMFLWMQSENAKAAKNLEGVETQIEWIRLLQPEFDTVHLFQIWNKAFNLSAQMATLSNKYSTILDAREYARSIQKQRPDDLNMIMAVANLEYDKFANSHEKAYYQQRIREDSKYRAVDPPRLAGARPTRYPSILTPDGDLRADLVAPKPQWPKPTTLLAGMTDYYDGAEMQFLAKYQPFPYGVSPFGLAYNSFKRAQVLQQQTGQQHLQISEMVIHSRPSLALKAWAYDEWDNAVAAEGRYLGQKVPSDRFAALLATAALKPEQFTPQYVKEHKADYDALLFQYKLADRLAPDAIAEFRFHMANPQYQMHVGMYRSHLDDLLAAESMIGGDLAMMQAADATGAARTKLLNDAAKNYAQAQRLYRIIRLRYYSVEAAVEAIIGKGRQLDTLSDAELADTIAKIEALNRQSGYDPYSADTEEYASYLKRIALRLDLIRQLQGS